MKKIVLILALTVPLLQVSAQLPAAEEIMNKSREMSLAGSISANISLMITEKSGAVRNRTISLTSKSYPDGTEKRIIRFLDPADVRGTAMLIYDLQDVSDEMWIYLPALKKTRRIVSSEKGKSFMSSEFSNADMSSPSLADFTNRHTAISGKDNQWVIESIPVNDDKADEYGYSKKKSYISMSNFQVQKMEFYNFDNELFKVIEVRKVFPLQNGKYVIKDMLANNLLNNRKSEIVFSNISAGINIDDSYFTLQNLER